MGLRDVCDFTALENAAEQIVIDEMERQLGPDGETMTEDQLLDIATYALNRVKPAYRSTLLGRLYTQAMAGDNIENVQKAVQQAIAKVEPA